MNRIFATLASVLLLATAVQAEPLPWSYSIWLKPAGGADGILYGTETGNGPSGNASYNILSNFGAIGLLFNGTETPTGTTDLFAFSHGNWNLATALPPGSTYSNGAFTLDYLFTSTGGSASHNAAGTFAGTISASGVFTSGTGNFTLGLTGDADVTLDGKKAHVQFGTRESESQTVVTMTVTSSVVETPEPATVALAGIGLAGVFGAKWRKRRKA